MESKKMELLNFMVLTINDYFRDSQDILNKLDIKKSFFWDYVKYTKNRKNLLDKI